MHTSFSNHGSLRTPLLQESSAGTSPPHCLSNLMNSPVTPHSHSRCSASVRALHVYRQRRLRAEESSVCEPSVNSARERCSQSRSLSKSSLHSGHRPDALHGHRKSSIQAELHAVRALLESAQLELSRLTSSEAAPDNHRCGSGRGPSSHLVTEPALSEPWVPNLTSALPSPPPLKPPQPATPPWEARRSRLERLAQSDSEGRPDDADPSLPSASTASVNEVLPSHIRSPRRPTFGSRSSSFFSARSGTEPSPSRRQQTPSAPREQPEEVPSARADAEGRPMHASSHTASPAPHALITDDALSRYEQFYRRRRHLGQARKQRGGNTAGTLTPVRHPGPHPSVHALRRLASPHPTAPALASPLRRGGSQNGRRGQSPQTREDQTPTLMEQVQHWPQRLRCLSSGSFTESEADERSQEGTRREASVMLYDPLNLTDGQNVESTMATTTDTHAQVFQAAHTPTASASHDDVELSRDVDEADDDAVYLAQLRDRLAAQRAEWLRVYQTERKTIAAKLHTPQLSMDRI